MAIELDLVATSQDGNHLLVGECKWSDKLLPVEELFADLERKAALLPFSKGKTIVPALFLKRKPTTMPAKTVFLPDDILAVLRY